MIDLLADRPNSRPRAANQRSEHGEHLAVRSLGEHLAVRSLEWLGTPALHGVDGDP